MKKLIALCLFIAMAFVANAQSHISTGKWACSLVPKSLGAEKYRCPACAKLDEQKRLDKIAEDKRQYDKSVEDTKKAKQASIEASKKQQQETAERNKVTEVRVTMPSGSSTTDNSPSQSDPSAGYTPTTPSRTTTQDTQRQAFEQAQATKNAKAERTELVVTGAAAVVGGLLDNWNAAIERKEQRREAERKTNEDILTQKYEAKFKAEYLPLMDKAKAGDENARMVLYFTSDTRGLWDYVPERWGWLEDAVKNNNTDALLERADLIFTRLMYKIETKDSNYIAYIEKAANLGSLEAMLWTANYAQWISPNKSTDTKKALELYTKAAEKGNPIAMYVLGIIYKYGYSERTNEYNKAYYSKFDVILDEKIAFEWFLKSLKTFADPYYKESMFARSRDAGESTLFTGCIGGGNGQLTGCKSELAKMFKEGKVVPMDKNAAKALEALTISLDNGKLSNIDGY